MSYVCASPLSRVDKAFNELTSGETLPVMDCWEIGVDLCDRFLTARGLVDTLRSWSTDRSTSAALWAETTRRAQSQAQPWQLIAVAGMQPRLRKAARRVWERIGSEHEDVESTILVGFIEAVRTCDPAMRNLPNYLVKTAEERARHTVGAVDLPRGDTPEPGPGRIRLLPLTSPAGHEDLVLAALVRDGRVTAQQANILVATCFDGMALSSVADALGLSLHECQLQHRRGAGSVAHALLSRV